MIRKKVERVENLVNAPQFWPVDDPATSLTRKVFVVIPNRGTNPEIRTVKCLTLLAKLATLNSAQVQLFFSSILIVLTATLMTPFFHTFGYMAG